jgi:hypothetical protein
MSGSTGSPRSNGSRAAAVRRLKAAVAERRQAREREVGKAVAVETDTTRPRTAEITVQRKDRTDL